MTASEKRFVVLYRWRIKPGREREFTRAWLEITDHFREHFGSLGSRLHKGSDGIHYAYAMWPDEETREAVSTGGSLKVAAKTMQEAAEERYSEVVLEIVADRLEGTVPQNPCP